MRIGYFLYDEGYSGVIDSQALDVVRFYNDQTHHNAVLIASLPFRTHRTVLTKFKESLPESVISMISLPQKLQPILFTIETVRLSALIKKSQVDVLICRNAIACFTALAAKAFYTGEKFPQICYDGRGALMAEACEFDVYPQYLKRFLLRAERAAVLNADYRIAVTEELVEWWRSEYGYAGNRHSIIPTTLSTRAEQFDPGPSRPIWRKRFGFTPEDLVLAFAGGKADWQGLDYWLPMMHEWLENIPNLKLLLLAPPHPEIVRLTDSFPNRIINTFVSHGEVLQALAAADHGVMWRENNITNKVASPTKFSEYLQAGLNIITNDGTATGRLVRTLQLGICIDPHYESQYSDILKRSKQKNSQSPPTKDRFYTSLAKKIRCHHN